MEKNIPTYKITVNDDDETGIDLISFVADPAIITKGLAFNKSNKFQFNKDKQVVAGPALIPDLPIYRFDNELGEYYVVFEEDTIRKMVAKFKKGNKNTSINLDHTDKMVDAYIQADWIIEDKENDKSNSYGFDLPIGTYFIEVKVDDATFWNEEIKNGEKFGFSIEGLMGLKLNNIIKNNKNDMTNDEKFGEATTPEGVTIYWDGELAVGSEIWTMVDDVKTSTPDATYTIDGKVIITDAESKVLSIEEVVVDEDPAEEMAEEPVMNEQAFVDILTPYIEEVKLMITELSSKVIDLEAKMSEDAFKNTETEATLSEVKEKLESFSNTIGSVSLTLKKEKPLKSKYELEVERVREFRKKHKF